MPNKHAKIDVADRRTLTVDRPIARNSLTPFPSNTNNNIEHQQRTTNNEQLNNEQLFNEQRTSNIEHRTSNIEQRTSKQRTTNNETTNKI
jgi:hypothetical protein